MYMYMKNFFRKEHIGIVERAQHTGTGTCMRNTAVTVLHKQWRCIGMQRNTHIAGNNLIPISVPICGC